MTFLIRLLFIAIAGCTIAAAPIDAPKPNILLLTAGDVGYGDLGCYGGTAVKTPNLDAFTGGGTKFNRYYAASAVSQPTRMSVLTGRYPLHWDITRDSGDGTIALSREALMLPGILKQAGYETAQTAIPATDGSGAEESVRLIQKLALMEKPFFIDVWFGSPSQSDSDVEDRKARHRSRIAQLDANVGSILHKLDDLKLRQKTLVLFSSANGPALVGSTGVFRGRKGTLFDGGLRVPCIASWPGVVKAGRTVEVFTHSTDMLPTVCGAARIGLPKEVPLDGQNFFPFLLGRSAAPVRTVTFWQMDAYADCQKECGERAPYATEAVLKDRWKLLCRDGEPVALYNLYLDVNESTDQLGVKDYRSRVVPPMVEQLKAWLAEPRVTWQSGH